MPQPYSYDLRRKVIQAIEVDGLSQSEVSKYFNISRHTIARWQLRKKETGDVKAKPNKPPGPKHKIDDWEKFQKFAEVYGDQTQEEMATLWKGEISARTISRALKKIGFTRKKKLTVTTNGMNKNDKSFKKLSPT